MDLNVGVYDYEKLKKNNFINDKKKGRLSSWKIDNGYSLKVCGSKNYEPGKGYCSTYYSNKTDYNDSEYALTLVVEKKENFTQANTSNNNYLIILLVVLFIFMYNKK